MAEISSAPPANRPVRAPAASAPSAPVASAPALAMPSPSVIAPDKVDSLPAVGTDARGGTDQGDSAAEVRVADSSSDPGAAPSAEARPSRNGTANADAGDNELPNETSPRVARTTSPAEAGPAVRPEDARRDQHYPDTGLPAVGPVAPEPAAPQGQAVSEPAPGTQPKVAEQGSKAAAVPWEQPDTLLSRVDELATHAATRRWAAETAELVRKLGAVIATEPEEAGRSLQRLEQLCAEASPMVASVKDKNVAQNLSRASHALERRLGVWKEVIGLGRKAAAASAPQVDPQAMSVCLAEIDSLTGNSEEGKAWRKYLLVESLREWQARRKSSEERLPKELSHPLLKRLGQTPMSPRQRQFVASGPVASLHSQLLRHSAEPVDAGRLLAHLERYERTGLASDGRLLADDCQHLAQAAEEGHRQLGRCVESHYRNANLRLAVSAELINRLVPKRDLEYAPVYDTVLGLPVRGESLTSSDLAIRMLPDPSRVRMAVEITGEVASLTSSTSGPATFITDSDSTYVARKPLDVDLKGIRLWPTEVDVNNDSRLRRVRTDFEGFPILSPLVRGVARSQYDQKRPLADAEVREKIAAQAKERIDKETSQQLTLAARQLHDKVLGPVDALALEPALIAAETTADRFVMRIRLAGGDQLGSHTPRPQAPANSLASVQVHESALNNVIQRLELDGQTFKLPELDRHIAKRLSRPAPAARSEDDEDVSITFADRDAIRLRCTGGRLEITLAVAKLSKSPRKWKDFQARAYYRPVVRGRSIEFERDGVVQLIGRLSTGSQLALRGVFAKTFAQKPAWNIAPEKFVNHPKLADLAFTQFAIDDGWIGVALGPAPHRTVLRHGLLRR
jgi:hypothetical protein